MTERLRCDEPSDQRLIPPFMELFFARQGGTCPSYELLTPRNTAHLWTAATQLVGVLDAQLIDVQSRIPLSHSEWGQLPWVVTNAPSDWFGRFIDAVSDLGDDAAAGRCPIPRCTGEEMALHLILGDVTDSPDRALCNLVTAAGYNGEGPRGDMEVLLDAGFDPADVRSVITEPDLDLRRSPAPTASPQLPNRHRDHLLLTARTHAGRSR